MIDSPQSATIAEAGPGDVRSPNGQVHTDQRPPRFQRLPCLWARLGPFLVAVILLLAGYLHYAPGTAYSLSAEHYRAWAFPAFRYSDLIWLYLRDGLDRQPVPYVDFPLEYPPLTGAISWILSWAADLPTYFALAYALLAGSALLAIWALQRIEGANPWLFAAAPALFLYTGHQWDMTAVGVSAIAIFAICRGRDGWGTIGLVAATSLKLFPAVFVAAVIVERLRDRRYRSAATIAAWFVVGTAVINLPVALANVDGWSFFYRWNRDRLADSGIWVLWRGTETADLTRWSMVAAVAGGAALTALAWRTRGPLFVPLGSTYLLWWLLVNKTFTTHLILWAFLAIALLGAPWWIWLLTAGIDLAGFQLGNYLNLYNVPDYKSAPLIRKAVENIYDPVQIARSIVLLVASLWGVHLLATDRLRVKFAPILHPVRVPAISRPPLIENAARPLARRDRALLAVSLGITLTVAAVAMTWPYAQHLGDATIVGFDPFLQIWLSEWIRHALTADPRTLYDANIFYPFAQTLAYTDANIPGALLAAPISVATGDPILTNSLLTLTSFAVAAAGVYAVIVFLTGNRGAGLAAGLAYAFLPYRMIHLWHLNWLEGAWLPWLVLALLWLLARPTLLRGAVFGLLAAILVLTSFYFSVQILLICATFVAAASIAHRRWPSPGLVAAGAMALLVTAAVAAPLDIPYLQVRDEQGLERTVVDAEQYKALPESYLQLAPWDQPGPLQALLGVRAGPNESLTEVGQATHADGHRHPEIVIEDALFPGLFAVVFAVVALVGWRGQRWLVAALACIAAITALLSLGPTLGPRHGDGPPLPYGFLFEHAPFFRSMRVPARLGGVTDLAIVLLAGLGMAAAWDRLRNGAKTATLMRGGLAGPMATALLTLAILAELWTGAVPIEAVDRSSGSSAAADWLAMQPDGPIMEFPAESVFADPAGTSVRRHYGEEMFWSMRHWMPLVNGNSGFIPRAYSDFIERFVGPVQRPDGSLTDRISHLEPDTARLLKQIDVRYLVFHRSQYRPQDWPAVAAELEAMAASGLVEAAGDHGEATIYVLEPAAPPIEPPTVALYAPTLGTPDSRWAPWLAIDGGSGTPTALSLTRPPMLETTWFNEDGRFLWHGTQRLPLPVVMDDPWLLCGAIECLTSRPIDDLHRLPPPDPDATWRPTGTGHYVVRYRLTGDHPLDCQVDLDLVATASDVQDRSRDEPYRWAECITGHPNPINNPGAAPFALGAPSVTLVGDTAAVDIAITPRQDEEVRGWFTLAPPGSQAPWIEAVYQSPMQQKLLPAAEPTAFEWTAEVDAPPGVYGLTVWFHRHGPTGWEHADGGDIHLAPIVVDDDHTLHWAGPVRVQTAAPSGPLAPRGTTRVELDVDGMSQQVGCAATWRLSSGTQVIASGNSGPCDTADVTLPATVAPGHYRLELDVYARRSDGLRLSDGVSFPITVIENLPRGQPR